MDEIPSAFWATSGEDLLSKLDSSPQGLTTEEGSARLREYGPNALRKTKTSTSLTILLSQFKSPLTLILIFAAVLSLFVRDRSAAAIILTIVLASAALGFLQERGATKTVALLLKMVKVNATVWRDGATTEISVDDIVPGDVVALSAGDRIPADCRILESNNLFIDEATLTGETFPVEKSVGVLGTAVPLAHRMNCLFMGTHVVSGTARALVVLTGMKSEFGKIFERIKLKAPETEFQRGVRRFGYFLMEVTLILVIVIFGINVYLARPIIDAFLFSLALAIGLTPQLLPAIITINLARGAKVMAKEHVIIKHLPSIENFGSMNVLCADKTGTLTDGTVQVRYSRDVDGNESERALFYAYLNAFFETGYVNPIDEAIRRHKRFDVSTCTKLDEIPYDFIRKRLSIAVSDGVRHFMVTKGALTNVVAACLEAEKGGGTKVNIGDVSQKIGAQYEELSANGYRTLGVAYKELGSKERITKDEEAEMTFLGLIVLYDPPKPGVNDTLDRLRKLGVGLKIITGDNRLVSRSLSQQLGMSDAKILAGSELVQMRDDALIMRVNEIDVFAEIEPNQKERVVLALRKAGNVVGFIGDGINDVSALHAADVSISVNTAVDVAKDAAEIVLVEKSLEVLARGIEAGRTTFANTLKYVFMATSANFGNMFSMAGASMFLPFLPLLPTQILLTNLLTDFPEMTIANDNVDREMVQQPRRWNIGFIRRFMLAFGILSSLFDYLTFGVLLLVFHASVDEFRTGWFIESVVSAALIVLVIRSGKPFFRSKPGRSLRIATLSVVGVTVCLPFTPLARIFEFKPVPATLLGVIALIVVLYMAASEITKKVFYGRAGK